MTFEKAAGADRPAISDPEAGGGDPAQPRAGRRAVLLPAKPNLVRSMNIQAQHGASPHLVKGTGLRLRPGGDRPMFRCLFGRQASAQRRAHGAADPPLIAGQAWSLFQVDGTDSAQANQTLAALQPDNRFIEGRQEAGAIRLGERGRSADLVASRTQMVHQRSRRHRIADIAMIEPATRRIMTPIL